MEGDVSAAISCQMPVLRIMEYPISHHDPFSAPSPLPLPPRDAVVETTAAVDSSDVALMGNLLTDMLSSDFPYGSSRYSVPDILQNFPADQASKITLLQMLEDSETTSPYTHLKLPVLEEPPDQKVLISSTQHVQQLAPPASPKSQVVIVSERYNKPCKLEPDPIIPALLSDQQQQASSNDFNASAIIANASTIINTSEQNKMATTTSANSENSSEKLVPPITATTSAGGVSQSSSGTDTQQKRPKRKRIKSCKNSEEVESQRQTHIAVERNRRKQMNEHLNVLRSLMPGSYVQRGDQASIIGGAIEFVKELEQLLQCLQAQKRRRMYSEAFSPKPSPTVTSMLQQPCLLGTPYSPQAADSKFVNDNFYDPVKEVLAEAKSEVADIEVKMIGCDAVVKILSQRRPGQLLKTISAIESMCMTIVHTNITTIEQTVLYSFTVKLGMECRLAVEEIAEGIQRAYSVIHGNSSAAA